MRVQLRLFFMAFSPFSIISERADVEHGSLCCTGDASKYLRKRASTLVSIDDDFRENYYDNIYIMNNTQNV